MDLKIIALWIVLYYNIVYLKAQTTVTYRNYFKVITDQRRTDVKTRSDIKWQKTFIGRKWLGIRLTLSYHICRVEWQIQSTICRKALRFEENGFNLGYTTLLMEGCKNTPYTIRYSTLATTETASLTTITCPIVKYTDLETGLPTDIPYHYKISIAGKPSSAIMYVQTDTQSDVLYPLYYIRSIAFKKIMSKKYFERSNSLQSLAQTELSNTMDIMSAYLHGRKSDLAYDKFTRFYSSMNLCGRPRPQKMYLCRRCINQQFPTVNFDLDGYNEDVCKEYDVRLSENGFSQPKNKLLLFRCPPIRIKYRTARNFFHFYYVSSNTWRHSLTLFKRENRKDRLPKLEANIYELQMEPIFKDIKRQQFLPGPPKIIDPMARQKSYQEIEDEINALEGEITTPFALIESKLPIEYLAAKINEKVFHEKNTEKWLNDNVTLSFSKVKSIKLIYQRFRSTYKSLDICSLSIQQRTLLCNEVFKKIKIFDEGNEEVELPFIEDYQSACSNSVAKLTTIDADEQETNNFSMWECHGDTQKYYKTFYLGKNHLKNSATIYARIQIGAEDYFYPHVLIAGINRYGLVKKEIEKKIMDIKKREHEIARKEK